MESSATSTVPWSEHQAWEKDWWGNCENTIGEELKQLSYFKRLGLEPLAYGTHKFNFVYDMQGKSVLDIGGGPCSFLLKCINVRGAVVDPCEYPTWVAHRYAEAKIWWIHRKGEDFDFAPAYDEVWMYNVLQHVENPQKVIENGKRAGKLIRFFDWIDYGVHPGHPHNLTEAKLNEWFEAKGTVEEMNENDAHGRAYYGVFPQ